MPRARVETEGADVGVTIGPGALVTPSVRLVRQIGAGAMGTIWLADHLALRTTVAVKIISAALAADAGAIVRFSREAAAASSLKSPHVVQIFDHGVTPGGLPFIVMEHLEGEDLATRLAREKKLAPGQVVAIVSQAAKALVRAAEKGVIHRDVKPENIFLCDVGGEPFVKLLDFGIAKAVEEGARMTQTGRAVGTPSYMSPEQVIGSPQLDARADVWSLAVVAFELLTGALPFAGTTQGALALAIHTQERPLPCAVDPSLPAAVDAWAMRAFAKDLEARFSTARELADSLSDALGVGGAVKGAATETRGRSRLAIGAAALTLSIGVALLARATVHPPPHEPSVASTSAMAPAPVPAPQSSSPPTTDVPVVAAAVASILRSSPPPATASHAARHASAPTARDAGAHATTATTKLDDEALK